MLRAVVLVLCLASAGGIAAYSYYSRPDPNEPVYTVPTRAPVPPAPKAVPPRPIAPEDQAGLARELQRELKRVGCYSGEVSGVWGTGSRLAMKNFVERVNAALPVDKPDPVLLSLVQAQRGRVCGIGCPPGQTAQPGGACVPSAVAGSDKDSSDPKTAGAAVGAAAAAAGMALAGSGTGAKKETRASLPDGTPGSSTGASAPPEQKPATRTRRTTKRPPKVLSDIFKMFGN